MWFSYQRGRKHLGATHILRDTMHDARHSFAVRWMRDGANPQDIANNLGHKDATLVLRIYGKYRLTASDHRRARGNRAK